MPTSPTQAPTDAPTLRDIDAVLLDMDGTLVDSDAAIERAWTRWAAEYGVDAAALLRTAAGRPALASIRDSAPWLDDAAARRAAQRQVDLQLLDLDGTTPLPGARRLVASLDRVGLPWAVVTSADQRLAHARLRAAGITAPLLIAVEDVRAGKPDPEGYLLAAKRLGVDPARCLVVEDSRAGVAAGRRAGARVAALRGHPADLAINDLGELARLLASAGHPWWSDALGYQVYLPSFQDSDGDGWGDLDGLRTRLDHLADLGIDLLWVTPFFVSPMRDHGYDIADYRRVDPRFGDETALDRLVAEAHRRGLRLIADLVVNHTSDQHRWFQAALADPSGPYRDYYLWRDPAPGGGPPNNWRSHFGGPAWTRDPASGQCYLHLFRPEQPDLNWRNPAVAAEVDGIIAHWLERGLDGFRIDTAAYLVKHPDLPDNPPLPDGQLLPIRGVTDDWRRQDHRYDIHQPDVHEIHARWRRLADSYGAVLIGEVYELDPARLAVYVEAERLHSSFWFGLVESDWEPARVRNLLRAATLASPRLSWVQSNHDRSRAVTRYGGGHHGFRRWLALQALLTFLPGTCWLYQGEELGLDDGAVPAGAIADPLGAAEPGQSRDGARTPMPWSPVPGLGFTSGRPWLPDGERVASETVDAQAGVPDSRLRTVGRLLATHRALRNALNRQVAWLDVTGDLVAYRRGSVVVAANLGAGAAALPAGAGEVVFDSEMPDRRPDSPGPAPLRLRPEQAVVLVAGAAGGRLPR